MAWVWIPIRPVSYRLDTRIVSDTKYACPAKLVYMGLIHFLKYSKKMPIFLMKKNPAGMGQGPYRIVSYRLWNRHASRVKLVEA